MDFKSSIELVMNCYGRLSCTWNDRERIKKECEDSAALPIPAPFQPLLSNLQPHLVLVLQPVSSPGESRPQALVEPDVNLSIHPAPIIQPLGQSPSSSERTSLDVAGRFDLLTEKIVLCVS